MIYEVSGDILLSKAEAIAHGVAPNDHFNQGLALALREQFPAMAKDFRHWCQQKHPEPGEVWSWGTAGSKKFFCLLTQAAADHNHGHPGQAKLPWVNHCLKHLAQQIQAEKIGSVALPKLATGVGGLVWKDVAELIEQHLGPLNIPVYVYAEYHKGVAAKEPAQKAAAAH